MLKSYFFFVTKNFSRRKLRGWLTILGILIGIASVVSLISINQGMKEAITEQFEKLGSNKLIINPGSGDNLFLGAFLGEGSLTKEDVKTVMKVNGVKRVAEMYYQMERISFKDSTKSTLVIGIPTDKEADLLLDLQGFKAEKGRDLERGDEYEITVGWNLWAGDFFDKKVQLRDKIIIKNKEFKVVGLIKKIGNKYDDNQVYIPLNTAKKLFNKENEVSSIFVEVKEGYALEEVADKIRKELRDSRNEKEGKEEFNVQSLENILERVNIILGIISSVLIVIAFISLLVGGIGIMNTMYTSVLERTKDIGIMKAVGIKNRNIMILFLLESGLYGFLGGVLGIILGFLIAKIAGLFVTSQGFELLRPSFSFSLIIGTLVFAFLVGCVSGVAPARTASKLEPVDALRYE